jgi:hypothetical protein
VRNQACFFLSGIEGRAWRSRSFGRRVRCAALTGRAVGLEEEGGCGRRNDGVKVLREMDSERLPRLTVPWRAQRFRETQDMP